MHEDLKHADDLLAEARQRAAAEAEDAGLSAAAYYSGPGAAFWPTPISLDEQ